MRGVIAAAAIVAIALAAFLLLNRSRDGDGGSAEKARAQKPAEAKPGKSNPASAAEDMSNPDEEEAPVTKPKAEERPSSPWANKPPRVIKHRAADKKPRRFAYDSEELIADLLEIEPGTPMFGELPYGKRFNEDFKKAVAQKVEINPEDDEYTVALKNQVQAVKDDFKQILLAGGDVGEEMRKARNELKELGAFRESLKRELFDLRKSGQHSSDDMKGYIEAANKMLEAKGLAPLKVPRVFLRNIELREGKTK